jgi:hypothetical protein
MTLTLAASTWSAVLGVLAGAVVVGFLSAATLGVVAWVRARDQARDANSYASTLRAKELSEASSESFLHELRKKAGTAPLSRLDDVYHALVAAVGPRSEAERRDATEADNSDDYLADVAAEAAREAEARRARTAHERALRAQAILKAKAPHLRLKD